MCTNLCVKPVLLCVCMYNVDVPPLTVLLRCLPGTDWYSGVDVPPPTVLLRCLV